MASVPSISYSITIRLDVPARGNAVSQLTHAVEEAGGIVTALDVTASGHERLQIDVTCAARDTDHAQQLTEALARVDGVTIGKVSDRTFLMHLGGKIEIQPKVPIRNRDDLSMIYTPGVARVCLALAENPSDARRLTIKRNTVAVVTDGSAVLGLGNLGAIPALPVMEGKAALFKRFAGIDAFPICLDTQDVDEIVRAVELIAPVFAGINLEDISAPRCFEVERRLRASLDIPVFHDDQHGTAIVVLAALVNALKVVHKEADAVRVVVVGAGAAGLACAKIILEHGVRDLVVCDIGGILHPDRTDLDGERREMAERTKPRRLIGRADDALEGADVVVGVSAPGAFSVEAVRRMAANPIVFAMANPVPEVQPEAVYDAVAIMATGRSDYPNQINNVLAFPGIFRGALDVRATKITEEMKVAAARGIASVVGEDELSEDYIVPSVFNGYVSSCVARAVADEARRGGVAQADEELLGFAPADESRVRGAA